MARRKTRADPPSAPEERGKPLEPPELEAFVRAFRDSFDGTAAARKAGYEKPHEIWPELLARKDVQARLRHYRAGIDMPDRSPTAVLAHLFERTFTNTAALIAMDPVTGVPRYDLRAATPAQLAALEIEETVTESGGRLRRVTKIRPRPMGPELAVIARGIGLDQAEGAAGEDALVALLDSARNSSFPIATQRPTRESNR